MDQFFSSIAERLRALFDPAALGTIAAEFLANALVAAATFFAYYLAWRLVEVAGKAASRRLQTDKTSRDFALTLVKFAILTLGIVNALAAIGVNTASLVASLGIAGLTVGFAARDALSNLISGVLIYWDRPFVIGDLVEVGNHYGRVDRITLRSTRVITPDGRMLAVPNTEIINTTVASYTNFPHLRISVGVDVGVQEDLDRVREILIGLVAADDSFMTDPPPKVVVTNLGDYNVSVELQVWIHEERDHAVLRDRLRESAFRVLTDAGVDMPFETLQLQPVSIVEEGR